MKRLVRNKVGRKKILARKNPYNWCVENWETTFLENSTCQKLKTLSLKNLSSIHRPSPRIYITKYEKPHRSLSSGTCNACKLAMDINSTRSIAQISSHACTTKAKIICICNHKCLATTLARFYWSHGNQKIELTRFFSLSLHHSTFFYRVVKS